MKKNRALIFFISFSILFVSCIQRRITPASFVSSKCYFGMTIKEFRRIAGTTRELYFNSGNVSLKTIGNNMTVYKIPDFDLSGKIINTSFIYFNSEGKLFKVENGLDSK